MYRHERIVKASKASSRPLRVSLRVSSSTRLSARLVSYASQTTAAVFSGVVDCGASYAFSCHDGFVHCVAKEGDGARRRWRARHGSKITATPQLVKIRKGDSEDGR